MTVPPAHTGNTPLASIRVTPRDRELIHTIYRYRVLRRDQLQRLFFPSKNTTNLRLKLLHQHGYLARRRLPVEYGQGSSQWLYLLGGCGASLIAQVEGIDPAQLAWRRSHNHVSTMFLEHTLMVNDICIAIQLAVQDASHRVERWLREEELKAQPDRVWIETAPGRRRQSALVPDAYGALAFGQRRAHFFFEADRATESNGRWAQKVLAYLAYVRSGAYARRYGTDCLRVLTVTTSEQRMQNLLRTTHKTGGGAMFWFTTLDRATPEQILQATIWRIPGQDEPSTLISPERRPTSTPLGAPILLYRS